MNKTITYMHLPFLPPPSFKDAYYMHRIYECSITCTQYTSSPLDTYIYIPTRMQHSISHSIETHTKGTNFCIRLPGKTNVCVHIVEWITCFYALRFIAILIVQISILRGKRVYCNLHIRVECVRNKHTTLCSVIGGFGRGDHVRTGTLLLTLHILYMHIDCTYTHTYRYLSCRNTWHHINMYIQLYTQHIVYDAWI